MKRKALSELSQLDRIERYSLLAAKTALNVEEAAILLGVSPATIYRWTMEKVIPHYKPNGKLVFFNKKDIEEWALSNRVASDEEVMAEAANY